MGVHVIRSAADDAEVYLGQLIAAIALGYEPVDPHARIASLGIAQVEDGIAKFKSFFSYQFATGEQSIDIHPCRGPALQVLLTILHIKTKSESVRLNDDVIGIGKYAFECKTAGHVRGALRVIRNGIVVQQSATFCLHGLVVHGTGKEYGCR